MDWFRRNWPDLVIGVALVAVVALIVVTLLSGGSLASLVRRDTPPDISDTTGTPNTPTSDSAAAQTTPGNASGNDIDVFVPDVASEAEGTANVQAGSANPPGGGGGAQEGDAQAAAQGQGAQSTPAGGNSVPQATAASGFRVAAGAVPSRPAAVSLAESYREGGLPVAVEQQDDLYLLWVGPYATRPEADRIAARIVAGGGDALVYTYRGEGAEESGEGDVTVEAAPEPNTAASASQTVTSETAAPVPVAQADSGTSAAVASAPETVAGAAPATANADGEGDVAAVGQRYLQVGAFVSDESAAPLRTQLETLGLSVSRTEDETGLVRLFVGPFEEARLAQTQSRLSAEGIVGSFPVTR